MVYFISTTFLGRIDEMAFAKISSELTIKSSIELDNLFVLEYMPFAPESYTKVYIYGKFLASGAAESDNSLERISKLLGMPQDSIFDAFKYWEEQGLVKISSDAPLEVEYIPPRHEKPSQKKFSKTKYADFNRVLMSIFPNRDFLPSELNEYYSCMEDYKIDVSGMLAIASDCKRRKGKDISWQYIVKVAQSMDKDGCHTYEEIEEKIESSKIISGEIKELFKNLKTRRAPDYEDTSLFNKWTLDFGFAPGTIYEVAKNVYGEMRGLDTVLSRYHSEGITELKDIEAQKAEKDALLSLTKELLMKLDVRYSHLDYYADYYVKKWLGMGFSSDSLKTIADYCFKNDKKSCERMNSELELLVKLGAVSDEDISSRFDQMSKSDEKIKEIMSAAKISGAITGRDRDNYNIWFNIWKMSEELVLYAAKLSIGEAYPRNKMAYLIKDWHERSITSVEEVNQTDANNSSAAKPKPWEANPQDAEMTNEEARTLIDSEWNYRRAKADEAYRELLSSNKELYEIEKALRSAVMKLKSEDEISKLEKDRLKLITGLGKDPEKFFPTPHCKICGDTGLVNGAYCECVIRRVKLGKNGKDSTK